jgi:hypothetical protein
VNNVILATSRARQEKLMEVAQGYDLAHAKVAGWRAVNEMVQYKKHQRRNRRAEQTVPTAMLDNNKPEEGYAPPKLRTEETLGYDE